MRHAVLCLAMLLATAVAGASPDNNLLWDHLYHNSGSVSPFSENVPDTTSTFLQGRSDNQVTYMDQGTVRALAAQNDVQSAEVRIWDGTSSHVYPMTITGSVTAAFRSQPSFAYDVWEASIPAQTQGTVVNYRIRLFDGSAMAVLKVSNGQYLNPLGQHIRGFDDDPNDFTYTVTLPVNLSRFSAE